MLERVFGKMTKKALQTIGAPATIQALASALEISRQDFNKYEAHREFLRMDPELNNALTRLALLTQFAYKGVIVRAGEQWTDEEKQLQELANKEANALLFRDRFFSIAKHLLRDGDEIMVAHIDDADGITQIQPLPISKTSIVEKDDQIGEIGAKILGAKKYILNEFDEANKQVFPQNDNQRVIHVALDNLAEEIYDIHNRYTFGVWSESPLDCLKTRVLWKQAILITDILWRYRNVPREVHEIDTSMFTPEKFRGETWEDQVQAAMTAKKTYMRDYANSIKKKKVDQGYVIDRGTKIYYTEPKRVAYSDPNQLIEQINRSIREGIGAYEVGKGTFASELVVASYVVLLPDLCAYKIKTALLELLKIQLRKKHKKKEVELDKLDIKISLVLDIFRVEMIRAMALAAATATHTLDELREIVGKDPLSDDQIKRLVGLTEKGGRAGQYAQTLLDLLRDTTRREEPTTPVTPTSRSDKQET